MIRLGGKEVSDEIMASLAERSAALAGKGTVPTLGILRVGQRPDDLSYERGILKKTEAAGVRTKVFELPEDVTQDELDRTFREMNDASDIHGILMFRPLPKGLSDEVMRTEIKPSKDADFMDIRNMAPVLAGDKSAPAPCTAEAVIKIIEHYGIDLTGKKAVVIGRSMVIGRPVSLMLLARNATVTVCHSKTADLKREVREADIVVACIGRAKMISSEYLREGQIVIDVGMNMGEDGKLCGDVDYDAASEIVEAATPVPGGVGSVTTSVLLKHVVDSCEGLIK